MREGGGRVHGEVGLLHEVVEAAARERIELHQVLEVVGGASLPCVRELGLRRGRGKGGEAPRDGEEGGRGGEGEDREAPRKGNQLAIWRS